MKITGYRLEKYIYKIDRGLADANNPSGEDLSIGSLLFLIFFNPTSSNFTFIFFAKSFTHKAELSTGI